MKMIQTLLRILAVSVLLAAPSVSQAALDAYMTVVGEVQGNIEGDVTLAGREGQIEVESFGYNVSSPLDSATGLPSGKRQHRPVRVLKPIDKASPLLFNALANNENLPNVTIRFWRPSRSGQEVQFYTVELLNARIVSITPSHSSTADGMADPMREVVSFTFQKIIFTYEDGGITAEDDWTTPVF